MHTTQVERRILMDHYSAKEFTVRMKHGRQLAALAQPCVAVSLHLQWYCPLMHKKWEWAATRPVLINMGCRASRNLVGATAP